MKLNRIACMDYLDYLKQIPDHSVDLVVTDPPYNISQSKNINYKDLKITKNFGDWDFGFDPEPVLRELKRVLKPNGQIYIFCGTKQIPLYMGLMERNGWFFRNLLVWYKTNPAPRLSKTNFVFANEYIIYAINEKVKPGSITFNFTKQSEMHNTFKSSALQGKERLRDKNNQAIHPTQKPLFLLRKLIETSSKPNDIILDVFMGIGSTAVAAKQTNRQFLGCEINKEYVKFAEKRLQ